MKRFLVVVVLVVGLVSVFFGIGKSINSTTTLRLFELVTPYKTQTILYRHVDNPDVVIELQMKDIGARGYLRRTVRVAPGLLWDSVEEVDLQSIDSNEWRRVDEYVNEHGLKGG